MTFYKRPLRVIIYVLMAFFIFSVSGLASIGVQPLTIQLNPRPGETVPWEFKLIPKEKVPEPVVLSIYQPVQQPNGELTFNDADSKAFPESQWVNLDNPKVLLQPNEEFLIKGKVKVPFNAKGSHLVAVMVEPQIKQESGALLLSVRYAVLINIQVDAPGVRPTAKINDFETIKGSKGEPQIRITSQNNSLMDYSVNAFVTIRDNKSKRLIERVELRPENGWVNRITETRMLPGSTLQYYGYPHQVLIPGEYETRLFYRFATSGQILLTKTLDVKQGDFVYPAGKLKRVLITPADVRLEGRPRTTAMKGIKIENKFNQSVKVILEANSEPDYPFAIDKHTVLEFKPGRVFILEPGRMAVAVISVRFANDAVARGNYGSVNVKVMSTDAKPVLLEENVVNLEAVVKGDYSYAAAATGISGDLDGSKYLLSVIIKNNGNIKLVPRVEVVIRDADGNTAGTARLVPEEGGADWVNPLKLITLTGYADKLKPGLYKAEVKIYHESAEVGTSTLDLQVK